MHAPVPEQPPPLHPAKTEPSSATAVRETWVPGGKLAAQSLPQLIPLGALTTEPFPKPDKETVNEMVLEFSLLKVATADCGVPLLIKIRHTPAPEQSPFQLARTEPEAGLALKLTCVPAG